MKLVDKNCVTNSLSSHTNVIIEWKAPRQMLKRTDHKLSLKTPLNVKSAKIKKINTNK